MTLPSTAFHPVSRFIALLLCCGSALAMAQDSGGSGTDDPSPQAESVEVTLSPEVIEELDTALSLDEIKLLAAPLTVDQLAEETAHWQMKLQDGMSQIASLKIAARQAEGERLKAVREEIIRLSDLRSASVEKFLVIVDAYEKKGGDPEKVQSYRTYVTAALAAEWSATDLSTLLSASWKWLTQRDGGLGILLRLALIIGSLFLIAIVARFVRGLVNRGLRRTSSLSKLLKDFLLKTVFWLTFAVGFMIVLGIFGVNVTPLFAVLGGASFIIAFAMQDTLGNLASGLMIMINKPFDVGDLIDTNGVTGTVEAVSISSTKIRTFDNQLIIMPNASVWGSTITNVTVSPTRRVDLVFGIGYGDDMDKATAILERLVAEHELVLDDPKPNIRVHELADSSVNFIVRPWTKTEDYWTVYWDLTKAVKAAFDAEGVSIPFPQRDVHLFQEGSGG
ncbi:MAG: mechanosensitive ion channel family protein [Xanthomonadales bacterium]|jgi:small conductance mechanosensitive channel|nr:mechanosensitive ion channel family protein [Xanthomonadales bacterium]